MTRYCLLSVRCKGCGQIGHLRIDCPALRIARRETPCIPCSSEDPHEKRGIKRKSSTQISTRPLKLAKFTLQADDPSWDCVCSLTYTSTYQAHTSVKLTLPRVLQSQNQNIAPNANIFSLDSTEGECWDNNEMNVESGEPKENVIFISDEDDDNLNANDAFNEKFSKPCQVRSNLESHFKPMCESKETAKLTKSRVSGNEDLQSKDSDEKSSQLKAEKYNIACVHIELFRSNKSPSTQLTQIGCVVRSSIYNASFFKAIKPEGIENYLDNYKLGGDLMQALHMTREDDGTFLFRSRFEIIEKEKKIVCVEEEEALKSFLNFLDRFSDCLILGVDEDTVSILVKKLKVVDEVRFSRNIRGFTYWKRVLKYLDVNVSKTIDLEEYYSLQVGKDLPSFTTAEGIASILLKCVDDVTSKQKAKKGVDGEFYKLCKRIGCIEHPRKQNCDESVSSETLEVFSSFRPSVSAAFSAEKLEQVTLLSESDSEPEETGKSCTGGQVNEVLDLLKFRARYSYAHRKVERIQLPVPVRAASKQSQHYWQIGEPCVKEGTVVCPIPRCNYQVRHLVTVRYSNIAKHLDKLHPGKVTSLLCPVCTKSVSPIEVRFHMRRCAP